MTDRPRVGRIATFDQSEFPTRTLLALKGDHVVSVCIPARDEETTVGEVVATVRGSDAMRSGLIDELVVIDDGSLDATASIAHEAGATVHPSAPPDVDGKPRALGKGGAMRRGLEVTSGDLVAFLDADVTNLRPWFVTGIIGPLLLDPGIVLVKGCYTRPIDGIARGGGRVTELVAKPALSLLFPELVGVEQPLAGETAARRPVLESLELVDGYGIEMGLLIDVYERFGVDAIAQVDLGERVHRNRPLDELAPQAREVLAAALLRAGRRR